MDNKFSLYLPQNRNVNINFILLKLVCNGTFTLAVNLYGSYTVCSLPAIKLHKIPSTYVRSFLNNLAKLCWALLHLNYGNSIMIATGIKIDEQCPLYLSERQTLNEHDELHDCSFQSAPEIRNVDVSEQYSISISTLSQNIPCLSQVLAEYVLHQNKFTILLWWMYY